MNDYPEVVAKIVDDYIDRLKHQLRRVPTHDRHEFLQEIRSHVYEAYQQEPAVDEVDRILRVLRNLGEPAEVVADRLPEAMLRSDPKRGLPLHILAGILIVLFSIPLGFGGVAVLLGLLAMLGGVVVVYYGTAAVLLLGSVIFLSFGLTRLYRPELWNSLVLSNITQMDPGMAQILTRLSPSDQGHVIIVFGLILAALSVTMLWLGKYVVRGTRFLAGLILDRIRNLVDRGRRLARREKPILQIFARGASARL
jgi:uncharacterized membrane protein